MTLRNTAFTLISTSDFGKLLWNHRKWYPGLQATQQPKSSPLTRKPCPRNVRQERLNINRMLVILFVYKESVPLGQTFNQYCYWEVL